MPTFDLLNDFRHSPQILERWMFAHQVDHNQILEVLQARFSVKLTQYQLYPFPKGDQNTWLQSNQLAHNDFNSYLGLDSSDLQSLDFKKDEVFLEWLRDHWQEHEAARVALGI